MAKKRSLGTDLALVGLYLFIGAMFGYALRGVTSGTPFDVPAGYHYVPSPQYTCDLWNKCSPA